MGLDSGEVVGSDSGLLAAREEAMGLGTGLLAAREEAMGLSTGSLGAREEAMGLGSGSLRADCVHPNHRCLCSKSLLVLDSKIQIC